ncbi:MAG: bifunctional oligoribonuclease/PAP phosphatase NrnA [Candidatus Omnitrophica bacterium]|jgi:phosphoesterase RecJ-like protein|nr:bifunctional oligoribonuclease/PAP phosphatase NrnA [Candidatus Omnitrophota bacterium]
MGINDACAAIKKYKRFLITVHTSPEGDALGAEVAFYNLVRKLGKSAIIVNEDKPPYGYDFLCKNKPIHLLSKKEKNIKFDCFVALDCADLKRTGKVYGLNKNNNPVLNIDHHISNNFFGRINWVDPEASSCSEMIFKLFKKLRQKIDKDTALALYTGIMTDTGSFRYSNTTAFTFQAAGELLKYGVNVPYVYRNAYENIPLSDIKLLLRILPKIKFYSQGRIIGFEIKKELIKIKRPSIDLADQLLSFGRSIKGAEVVVLFKENSGEKNQVRVNLRSQGKVDVNKIASFFQGGGHKTASGCTLVGSIEEIEKEVITKIQSYLI